MLIAFLIIKTENKSISQARQQVQPTISIFSTNRINITKQEFQSQIIQFPVKIRSLYLGAEFLEEKIVYDRKGDKITHRKIPCLVALISHQRSTNDIDHPDLDAQEDLAVYLPSHQESPREPMEVSRCKNSLESSVIVPMVTASKFCPACKRAFTVKQLSGNFERNDAIRMLRHEIKLSYPSLSDQEKKKWRPTIEEGMEKDQMRELVAHD